MIKLFIAAIVALTVTSIGISACPGKGKLIEKTIVAEDSSNK